MAGDSVAVFFNVVWQEKRGEYGIKEYGRMVMDGPDGCPLHHTPDSSIPVFRNITGDL